MTKSRQNKKVLEKASLECIANYIKDNKGTTLDLQREINTPF